MGVREGVRRGRLARDDRSRGVRRLGARRHRSRAHARRDLRGRRGHERRLAHPLLHVPADAGDQARQRGAQAPLPAEDPHRRDRDVVRRHRAERRHRHLAHPDVRRAARATASSSTAARCGTPTRSTPRTCCCSRARRRATDAKPFRGLTLFFTPFDRSKITVREIEKLGRAAVDSNEIFIDGLEIPAEDVVGEVGRASITCSTR